MIVTHAGRVTDSAIHSADDCDDDGADGGGVWIFSWSFIPVPEDRQQNKRWCLNR